MYGYFAIFASETFKKRKMIKFGKMLAMAGAAAALASCGTNGKGQDGDFKYLIDEFADIKIMKYRIPGWDGLTLQQKEYVYHLGEAAKYGRDIIWMQNCKENLHVRKVIEAIIEDYDYEYGLKIILREDEPYGFGNNFRSLLASVLIALLSGKRLRSNETDSD